MDFAYAAYRSRLAPVVVLMVFVDFVGDLCLVEACDFPYGRDFLTLLTLGGFLPVCAEVLGAIYVGEGGLCNLVLDDFRDVLPPV